MAPALNDDVRRRALCHLRSEIPVPHNAIASLAQGAVNAGSSHNRFSHGEPDLQARVASLSATELGCAEFISRGSPGKNVVSSHEYS